MKDNFFYKNQVGSIVYSEEDKVFYGKLLNITDLISYEASTKEKLEIAFKEAVDSYLDTII